MNRFNEELQEIVTCSTETFSQSPNVRTSTQRGGHMNTEFVHASPYTGGRNHQPITAMQGNKARYRTYERAI